MITLDNLTAIAEYLKVSIIDLDTVDEWDKVYLVTVRNKRPRFVSKKVALEKRIILNQHDLENVFAELNQVTQRFGTIVFFPTEIKGSPIPTKQNIENWQQKKVCLVEFKLENLENGYYIAKGGKGWDDRQDRYLRIEGGAVVQEWSTWKELLTAITVKHANLPNLIGTNKDIEKAKAIRYQAIASGYSTKRAAEITSAKDWVESSTWELFPGPSRR